MACGRCEAEVAATERYRNTTMQALRAEVQNIDLDTQALMKILEECRPGATNPISLRYSVQRTVSSESSRVLGEYCVALSDCIAALVYRSTCNHAKPQQ